MRYVAFFILLVAILLGRSVLAQSLPPHSNVKPPVPSPPVTVITYEKAWKQVEALEKKRLPKSALAIVNQIYEKAKQEKKADQLVKAVIHRLKFTSYTQEDAFVLSLLDLKKEATNAEYPAKPILHSMLAEMYWSYYEQNRYKILDRTPTQGFANDDIRTWDLRTVVENVQTESALSLVMPNQLRQTPIDIYQAILIPGDNGRMSRPTLYDFLAHRAIDFYSHSESSLTQPANQFLIREEAYFAPSDQFASYALLTTDTLNFTFHSARMLQQLLQFRLRENDLPALMEVDLKRLALVFEKSIHPEKERLYRAALEALEVKYAENALSAEISYQIADQLYRSSQKYKPLESEANRWEAREAYERCAKAIKRFPASSGAQNCRSLQAAIREKDLQLTIEKVNLPKEDFRALISFKNINKLFLRLVKTNEAEFKTIPGKNKSFYENTYQEKLIRFYAAKKPIHQIKITLPNAGDYQQHAAEGKIPGVPLGDYVLLAGTDSTFTYKNQAVAYQFVTISSLAYLHRDLESGEMEFYVTHRKTGAPIPGVHAQVFTEEYDQKTDEASFKKRWTCITDPQGNFKVAAASGGHRTLKVDFTHQGDFLTTSNRFEPDLYEGDLYQRPEFDKDTSLHRNSFYFMDRAIYRPGQTIYFKGITLKTDWQKFHQIQKKMPLQVTLYDVNDREVAHLDLVSNEFGTFSGSFTAPTSGLNGKMRLSDGAGAATFLVEDYQRPNFEVAIPAIPGTFRLGNEVRVKGKAQAYSGAHIDQAAVKFRVVRNASFPYWWYYWKGYYPTSAAMEITQGVTKTDAKGEFEVIFQAIPDLSVPKESNPTYSYTIYADVTDGNGETRSAEKELNIGYQALKLNVSLPELLDRESKPEFSIQTTNLNGEPEPSRGTIRIDRLKSPDRTFRERLWPRPDTFLMSKESFYQYFPYDIYDEEDKPFTWEKDTKVLEQSFDTKESQLVQLADLKSWKPGNYVAEFTSTDAFGELVKEVAYFTVVDRKAKELPFPATDWFQVLKGQGEPGEKAELLVGAADKLSVLYELEQDRKIISKQWLNVEKGQKLLEIPLIESYRGNIGVHYTFIHQNRLYTQQATIEVPYTNKMLDVTFETFRNKLLPGEKEEWKIRIRGKKGEKVAAEMVATLYDASLDAFRTNAFNFSIYNTYYASLGWSSLRGFDKADASVYSIAWNRSVLGYEGRYDELNWFISRPLYYYLRRRGGGTGTYYYNDSIKSKTVIKYLPSQITEEQVNEEQVNEEQVNTDYAVASLYKMDAVPLSFGYSYDFSPLRLNKKNEKDLVKPEELIKARTNFNETAFFYPQLQTDANGEILVAFTIPEALTRWKMLGFAHTQDLQYGLATNSLVTQKELMITANAPRFFREGDALAFTAKVVNLSASELSGTAQLRLFDALTMQPIDAAFGHQPVNQPFSVKKGQSTGLSWHLRIPEGVEAVTYRVVAQAGTHSDGEEKPLPILTNRMLVTESLPLPIRGNQTKTFQLDKLVHNQSTTLRSHRLTLEWTANPAWYAVQALPYLMEYPYECAEQTFSRLYANGLASHIANSHPKIKRVFESWKNTDSNALLSNLEKNPELKAVLLEETPWVLDAKDESERKKRVALLFDLNRMASEQQRALTKLAKLQKPSGGWPWFEGMPENSYITQHILAGLGHLDHLGVKTIRQDENVVGMAKKALSFIDQQLQKQYEELKKLEKKKLIKLSDNHLSHSVSHYLYTRSFFKEMAVAKSAQEAFAYFQGQAQRYWLSGNAYQQGMIALALFRGNDQTTSAAIVKSLREHAITNEEMGMYWKNEAGFYWYQAPIETQALMIEMFDEVAKDAKAVEEMKVWLLKQKQTQDWQTTKATTEACYALLLKGSDWLNSESTVEIRVGDQVIDPTKLEGVNVEAGTGYFKTSWSGSEIQPAMGRVTLEKKEAGVSWGALYWQYFEQLDKITPHATPLQIQKGLFLQKDSPTGPVLTPLGDQTQLHPGDLLKVRIELRVDRTMEYVHMKDMRAAGLEPTNVLSGYRYQGGLGYYESTRDAATHFFFDYLPKGTYVFEYPLRVTHEGDFSNGITSIQSMYAPEFSSHSQGTRLKVEK